MCLLRSATLTFFFFVAIATSATTIATQDTFALKKNDYLDLRIDANQDGTIDLWLIHSSDYQIKHYKSINEDHTHLRTTRFPRLNVLISNVNGNRKILKWIDRSPTSFHFTQTVCEEELKGANTIKNALFAKEDISEFAFDEVVISLIDESCDEALDPGSMPFLQDSLALLLNNSKSSLQSCLAKDTPEGSLKKIQDSMKMAQARAKLASQNYLNSPEAIEPLIFCESKNKKSKTNGQFSGGSASYVSDKIMLTSDNDRKISFKDQKESTRVLTHEYLHHLGVEDEKHADLITQSCTNDGLPLRDDGTTLFGNQSLALASANKAQEIVASSNQGISKAAAETVKSIPSSPSVAPAQMAKIHKAAGASGVEAVSRSQTSGMLASANNLMGLMGTRATAATKSTGSSTRAPSSSGAVTKYKSDSLVTTKSRLKSKAGKAQAGETMVEEYVLGQGSKTSAKRRPSVRQGPSESVTRQPANITNEQPTAAPTATVDPPRRQGGTEMARANAGGNSAGISSLPSSSGSAARRPANASPRASSGSAADNTSTEEYVTYFTQNNYAEVKQKLRDSEFVEKLREASITVLDLRGTVYGAEKGNVILLDRGDRFVPQR